MPRIPCVLLHASLFAAITVALPARRIQPDNIFYVTNEVFGLTENDFRNSARRGSQTSLLPLMRQKDRENFERLREQGGDGQAYNFVIEVIREAFEVANNEHDEQEAFESIKGAYTDMKQQDKKILLRFFKKFNEVFSKDYDRDHDSSEDGQDTSEGEHSDSGRREDEAEDSLQRVEEILKEIEDADRNFDFTKLTASIEKLLRKSSRSWTANDLKRLTRAFEEAVQQVLDDLDGASRRDFRSMSRQVDKIVQAVQQFFDVLDIQGFAQGSAKRSLDRLVNGRRIDPKDKLDQLLDVIKMISFGAKSGKRSKGLW